MLAEPVAVLSEERRWDALRAVAYQHLHVEAIPDLPAVVAALGLDGAGTSAGRRSLTRPCPRCHARPGTTCVSSSGAAYTRGHHERHRGMTEGPPAHRRVPCPYCRAEPGAPCRSGGEPYSKGHSERHALAADTPATEGVPTDA